MRRLYPTTHYGGCPFRVPCGAACGGGGGDHSRECHLVSTRWEGCPAVRGSVTLTTMSRPPTRHQLQAAGVAAYAALSSAVLAACSSAPAPVTGVQPAGAAPPAVVVSPAPPLPPIPDVRGPLSITVIYPKAGSVVMARDSNFIFGSVGSGDATLSINGYPVKVEANGAFLGWLPVPDTASPRYDLVVARGADTARYTHPIAFPPRRAAADSADSAMARTPFPDSGRFEAIGLIPSSTGLSDTDRVLPGRPIPGGTYKWFFWPGTIVQVTGRAGGGAFWRVRLDSSLDAWVNAADMRQPPGTMPVVAAPHHVVTGGRVVSANGWVDVVLPVGASSPPAYLVEEHGTDLVLTLYGTIAAPDVIQYNTRDSLVRAVTWEPITNERAQFTVHLTTRPYGYLMLWDAAANRLVLRVRRPPVVDPSKPLAGRVIVVDPGHPPIGSTGPTGLWEPVATLAVGQILQQELIARGATVVMTRTTPDPVALEARPAKARQVNGELLVSIHLNALPDGMNPYTSHGTGTYFFQPHSIALARDVQEGMLRRMGLRDRGIFYENFALVRTTWMPAVLCEGAFIIMPDQEAALRTPEFQRAYALGLADGIETFFRSLGHNK
jgi:N-acetylmuramoyl-L-alanine amidase